MTEDDPVDVVIAAYHDYLENGGTEPSLDHLDEDQRREAAELIDLMTDVRGVDFYRSAPSLDSVLAGTDLEHKIEPPVTMGLSLDAIRVDVVSALGAASEPIVDSAAENEGVRSNAVSRYGPLRIRFQYRDDVASAAELALIDPRAAVGGVHGRFPETAATVLIIGDPELSSVAIDQYDTEEFIGSPDGESHPPRITRPVLPLFDTLRRLVDELAPDLSVDAVADDHEPVELADMIEAECREACAAIVAEGKKSRTDAKKEEWPDFDGQAFLAALTRDAASGGLTEEEIGERIAAAVAA
jgi:hypothetical protein